MYDDKCVIVGWSLKHVVLFEGGHVTDLSNTAAKTPWKLKLVILWVIIDWLHKLAWALTFLLSDSSIQRASRRLQWIVLSSAVAVFLIKALFFTSFSQSKVLRACGDKNWRRLDTHEPQLMLKRKLFMVYEGLDHQAAKCINDLDRISCFCSISLDGCAVSAILPFSS